MLRLRALPEDIEIKIPEDWSEITLRDYCHVSKIVSKDDFDHDKIETSPKMLRYVNEICLTLCPVEQKDFKRINYINVLRIYNAIASVVFVAPQDQSIKAFEFEGQRYELPDQDFSDLTFERYMDIQQLFSMIDDISINEFDALSGVIACLVGRYTEENNIAFKELPMSIAWQVFFFISRQTERLRQSLSGSLQEEQRRKTA